ncbi:Panacea domain-containing protein [Methylosinus sp. PW1]|uniref:Panacea domain-containing protein n=1 Tax=Methylosinus sp. PW1 TaxID=107636 RepID=UPI00055CDA93|nr:type II toxin-antitoxin system antitoxin SocA domain-containing protein [Methylosinus sp. PW1]
MSDVFDVAKYVLTKCDKRLPITTWKLQKLVYYSQAWSLVWDDKPLFYEPIEAWANGPVCPRLYEEHKGKFKISELTRGKLSALTKSQKETIEKVVAFYGKYEPQYLSELTHAERPWKEARKGLKAGERGNRVISHDLMAEYYGGL